MIAAIARANGASVVTRDIRGFEDCGVPLIDPWQGLERPLGTKSLLPPPASFVL